MSDFLKFADHLIHPAHAASHTVLAAHDGAVTAVITQVKQTLDRTIAAKLDAAEPEVRAAVDAEIPALINAFEAALPEPVRLFVSFEHGAIESFVTGLANQAVTRLYALLPKAAPQ